MADQPTSMIELKDIVVKFGNFEALHSINVDVKQGEFFTFLGPSGCGKTTTLRTITGFIEPVSGTVNVNGKDITHVPIEKRNIGIVFQSYALFPTMTVYDNIAFGLKIQKLKKDEIDRKVRDIARKVDLSDEQLQKAVSQLSGGQQQRVAIARALVTGPAIICMDEPLSNLDAKLRVQLRNELKKMQRDFGITTIYVTHDQEEALTLSDRIAVFNKGFIEQIGTPNEVYNHSKTEFVCNFIGDINRLEDELTGKMGLDKNQNHFIRLERIRVNREPQEGELALPGVIESREYYGLYIKYYIRTAGQVIKVIERNDGVNIYEAGEQVSVGIHPRNLMSYPKQYGKRRRNHDEKARPDAERLPDLEGVRHRVLRLSVLRLHAAALPEYAHLHFHRQGPHHRRGGPAGRDPLLLCGQYAQIRAQFFKAGRVPGYHGKHRGHIHRAAHGVF